MNKSDTSQSLNSQLKDTNPESVFKKYLHLKISTADSITTPVPVITINGASISTEGNFSVLSGDPKSGKSAVTNVVIAGAINPPGNQYDGFESLHIAENKYGKAVLHMDTEQARHHHQKALRSILKRVNITEEPSFLLSYNLRSLDVKNYMEVCKDLFKAAYNKFNGIHLAIIDGGADFIKSVNDEAESNMIVGFFEKLAIEFKTAIVIIIHLNPNSDKQRGHLGSQFQRKAESVLAIKRNGNLSYIEPQFLRGAGISDIPQIQFQFDKEKGYHTSCGIHTKISKEEQYLKQLEELVPKVFSNTPITYTDAVKKLTVLTKLSERTIDTRIKLLLEKDILSKTKDGQYMLFDEQIDTPELNYCKNYCK